MLAFLSKKQKTVSSIEYIVSSREKEKLKIIKTISRIVYRVKKDKENKSRETGIN